MSDLTSLAEKRRQSSIYLIIICLILTLKAGMGLVVNRSPEQAGHPNGDVQSQTIEKQASEKRDKSRKLVQSVTFRDAHSNGEQDKMQEMEPGNLLDLKTPKWRKNAVTVNDDSDKPRIAIVIDDIGLKKASSKAVMQLNGPLTLAFLPYADMLGQQVKMARESGHEILVHMPMQPVSGRINPGPNALNAQLKREQLEQRVDAMLSAFNGFVGINNHMGSRFTADKQAMDQLMQRLADRGLLFLDSLTTPDSVGAKTAARHNVPFAVRNVFLDHVAEPAPIHDALKRVEHIARKQGHAIAIGHPKDPTIKALKQWIPKARSKGFQFVPVSAVVKQMHKTAHMQKKQAMHKASAIQ